MSKQAPTSKRDIILRNVEYIIDVEQEESPVRGNVLCSGDAEDDERAEEHVLRQLRRGNHYAWCRVVVRARLQGFEGVDTLGCVNVDNFNDIEQVVKDHQMRETALDCLIDEIRSAATPDPVAVDLLRLLGEGDWNTPPWNELQED